MSRSVTRSRLAEFGRKFLSVEFRFGSEVAAENRCGLEIVLEHDPE